MNVWMENQKQNDVLLNGAAILFNPPSRQNRPENCDFAENAAKVGKYTELKCEFCPENTANGGR